MTFRAKPVVKRAHRSSWEGQDRRNLFLNIGFGLIVILAVGILVVAAGVTYYNDHLAPVGSINGQSVSKDEYRDRPRSRPGASMRRSVASGRRPSPVT